MKIKRKPYLIKVEVMDGEHEHSSNAIYWASSIAKANAWADAQCADGFGLDPKDGYWNYGDGTTGTKLRSVHEITVEQAEFCNELGVAYNVNK
jgi:hypothetical protein